MPSSRDVEKRQEFYLMICCNDEHKKIWALCISLNIYICHLQPAVPPTMIETSNQWQGREAAFP